MIRPFLAVIVLVTLLASASLAQVPAGFFGNHVGHETPANWPTVPIGIWRSWDVFTVTLQGACTQHNITWAAVGVADNNYCWSNLDMWVSYVSGKGLDIDYVIGKTPTYAGSTIATPPTDLGTTDQFFKNFVSALTTRYNGSNGHGFIKYYEIWNEPNSSTFWTGTHQQLATMVHDASVIIRANSPTALIISPASQGYSSYTYLDSLLTDGIAADVDIIGYHNYLGSRGHAATAGNPPTDGPEYTLSLINSYLTTQSNHSVNLPMWNTEFSFGCVYNPGSNGGGGTATCSVSETQFITDQEVQASWLARTYIIQASKGLQRSIWYGWDFSPYGTQWENTGGTIGIWPSGYAWSNLQNWIVGATFTSACSTADAITYTCDLRSPSGVVQRIVWNSGTCTVGSPCTYSAPGNFIKYQVLSDVSTADSPANIVANTVSLTSNMPALLTASITGGSAQNGVKLSNRAILK